MDRAQVLWKGAPERVRAPSCPDPVAPRGAIYESGCLGMQPQLGGKFRPRLNMGERPIANKYREDFEKRVKECLNCREGSGWGLVMRPGRMGAGDASRSDAEPSNPIRRSIRGVDQRGLSPSFRYARGDVAALIVVCSTRLTAFLDICVLRASACGLPIRPILKHGPRSLTCDGVAALLSHPTESRAPSGPFLVSRTGSRMNRKPGYGAQLRANLEPSKGVGRLRQQDGGHGSQNPLRSV
ncbi:hypothetical protein YC2023_074933 [Brassica napus]